MIGIYKIENIVNHKVYIGQSRNVYRRLNNHQNDLIKNKHANDYLQKSFNKYGLEKFVFELIEECSIEMLNEKEIYWINFYGGENDDKNFNLKSGGNVSIHFSDLAKEKLSKAKKGKPLTEKQKEAHRLTCLKWTGVPCPKKGRPQTPEKIEKYRKKLIGRICINDGEKNKMVYPEQLQYFLDNGWVKGRKYKNGHHPSKGTKITEEQKKILRKSALEWRKTHIIIPWNKGIKYSEERKQKIRKRIEENKEINKNIYINKTTFKKGNIPWNVGITHSDETKEKLRNMKLGKILVNNGEKIKSIKKDELDYYLSNGWQKGMGKCRKSKKTK